MDTWWTTDLPTWLVAIGTIGAFGTGGAVLLRELNRDRERDAAAERQQASAVVAWPARVELTGSAMARMRAILILSNGSQEPVYHVDIEYSSGPSIQIDQIDFLPPGRQERDIPAVLQETWVKSDALWMKRGSPTETAENPQAIGWNFGVALSFVDASGRAWRREIDGSLHRH